MRDFAGVAVVKTPPANAGDMGSIPGPGRSHIPQSSCKPVHHNYSASTLGALEPKLLKPACSRAQAPQLEKSLCSQEGPA